MADQIILSGQGQGQGNRQQQLSHPQPQQLQQSSDNLPLGVDTAIFGQADENDHEVIEKKLQLNAAATPTQPSTSTTDYSSERDDDGQHKKITDFVLRHTKRFNPEDLESGKVKSHRNRYSDADLRKVLDMVEKIQEEAIARSGKKLPIKKIVDYFRTQTPYKTLSESMITRWTKRMSSARIEQRKRGRKVNEKFECDVYEDLLKTAAANAMAENLQDNSSSSGGGGGLIFDISKVTYDAVRLAAARVRSTGEYHSDKAVTNLQFTNKWVDGIKRRFSNRQESLIINPFIDQSAAHSLLSQQTHPQSSPSQHQSQQMSHSLHVRDQQSQQHIHHLLHVSAQAHVSHQQQLQEHQHGMNMQQREMMRIMGFVSSHEEAEEEDHDEDEEVDADMVDSTLLYTNELSPSELENNYMHG